MGLLKFADVAPNRTSCLARGICHKRKCSIVSCIRTPEKKRHLTGKSFFVRILFSPFQSRAYAHVVLFLCGKRAQSGQACYSVFRFRVACRLWFWVVFAAAGFPDGCRKRSPFPVQILRDHCHCSPLFILKKTRKESRKTLPLVIEGIPSHFEICTIQLSCFARPSHSDC